MSPKTCRVPVVSLLLLAPVLQGQELRLLDRSPLHGAAYDLARDRIVTIGRLGETHEFDGSTWRNRPLAQLDFEWAALVHDPVRQHELLCGTNASAMFLVRYDGVGWQPVPTAVSPSARAGFSCVFDRARGEVVLLGGWFYTAPSISETWTFDGANWHLRNPASSPSQRSGAAFAYDSNRGRSVLFGGYSNLDDTWEWDGTNWTRVLTALHPTARDRAMMAFDPTRNRTVLFGGFAAPGNMALGDLWEYDGLAWLPVAAPAGPAARGEALAVFDEVRGETVLVGGRDHADTWSWNGTRWLSLPSMTIHPTSASSTTFAEPSAAGGIVQFGGGIVPPFDETWRWDGANWTRHAGPGPGPRHYATSCTGPGLGYLFGGGILGGATLGDFWTWNGAAWSQVTGAGPPARTKGAMAYDWIRNEVVLFGGNVGALADTWIFDGAAWHQRQPANSPAARFGHAMAYDGARGNVVLCGGTSPSTLAYFTDTWLWDGTNWTAASLVSPPPPSDVASMAFDVQRMEVVLVAESTPGHAAAWSFDGQGWQPIAPLQIDIVGNQFQAIGFPYPHGVLLASNTNVYSLNTSAPQVTHYGTPCSGNAPDVGGNRWPALGALDFGIDVVRGPASSFVALLGAVQNATVAVGGCTLLVQPGQVALLLSTSPHGATDAALPVPNATWLLGVDLFFQVAALDPGNPSGFVLSRGLQVTIGV